MTRATTILWFGLLLSQPATPQDPPTAAAATPDDSIHRIDLPSLITCGGCHRRAFEEWSSSLHHRAWTNANVRQATSDFAEPGCRGCHSPMPVLDRGLERRPKYRNFNQEDGVHCLSCHGTPDGESVAASRSIPGAPCRPRFEPDFVRAELCFPCHEPTHQAFTEYRESDAAALGLRCVDCHMPPRGDAPGRSHGAHGGLSPEFVRRGVDFSSVLEDDVLVVTLRNRTGHKFPGEIPSRSFTVCVEAGGPLPIREVLRRPAKGEDRVDNRLAPDEVRRLRIVLPNGSTPSDVSEIRVRYLWKPFALMPDDDAWTLGEETHSSAGA